MADDRGSIRRIDFAIDYPDGRKKHVTISDDPTDNEYNHYALSEIGGFYFGDGKSIDGLWSTVGSTNKNDVKDRWGKIGDGDELKPAMLVLKLDGKIVPKCGKHRNGH